MKIPVVGEQIYIRSSYHISCGSDDVHGGLATISKVDVSKTLPEDHTNSIFVEVAEVPGHSYNYFLLMEEQEELKKEFGETTAYPDPDIDTPWIEEGDIVSGRPYNGPPI